MFAAPLLTPTTLTVPEEQQCCLIQLLLVASGEIYQPSPSSKPLPKKVLMKCWAKMESLNKQLQLVDTSNLIDMTFLSIELRLLLRLKITMQLLNKTLVECALFA